MKTFNARSLLMIACAGAALAACASRSPAPVSGPGAESSGPISSTGRNATDAVSAARETTREGVPGAATAPLEDLNLRRNEIPQTLTDIDYVYEAAPRPSCRAIRAELVELDAVLSRDYDVIEEEQRESLGRKGGEAAGDLVVDTIRGVTTDVIPFRSLVREASGAASYERRRSRAFAAGYARRAYLKGIALGRGCTPPASPLVLTAPEDDPRVDQRETNDAPVTEEWEGSRVPPS